MIIDIKKNNIDNIFKELINNPKNHIPNSKNYLYYKKYFEKYYVEHKQRKLSHIYLGEIGSIKLPFYQMGNISSYNLLGIDELIIFCFYIKKKNKLKNVADLGANIGLHSIILDKLNFNVKSFEPDSEHIIELKKNLLLNKSKKVKTYGMAVDIKHHKVEFTRLLNNTTASFIKKSKKNYYGPIKKTFVKTYPFKKILNWANMLKIDVEGMEAELIENTYIDDWKNKLAIIEIGTEENAEKIFDYAKKIQLNIFSQKLGWNKALKLKDVPKNYKDGSVILTSEKDNPWH